MSEETALAHGYVILDLSNDWVPTILTERLDEAGNLIPNNYRGVYRGLANDLVDADGARRGTFLEVFGIPPSLGVIAERVLDDEKKASNQPGLADSDSS